MQWNEGLARAARHIVNDKGACGTDGDAYGKSFEEVLNQYYAFNVNGLKFIEVTAPCVVSTTPDAQMFLQYMFSQECLDTNILQTKDYLQIGIGCACAPETVCGFEHKCIIAVSKDTEARDITE